MSIASNTAYRRETSATTKLCVGLKTRAKW